MRKLIAVILLLFLLPIQREETHTERIANYVEEGVKFKLKRADIKYASGCRGVDEAEPNPALAIPPLKVSDNRLLVTVCDSLYMLDSSGEVIWYWSSGGASITAQPVIDATGTIYVVGLDFMWLALDAETGLMTWNHSDCCSKAMYTQMKAYKDDQYLVVVDYSGYRDLPLNIKDAVVLCRGKEIIASSDFPTGARLEVWSDKILAVSYQIEGVIIEELKMQKG